MNSKFIATLGFGFVSGFVSGSVLIFGKMLDSERMKKAFSEIVTDKIDEIIFGEPSFREHISKVSYRQYYSNKNDRNRSLSRFIIYNLIFDTRMDAENVLGSMRDIMSRYGVVSVADYYDIAGMSNYEFEATKYGWTDLKNVQIISCKWGYRINFPKPILFNSRKINY